MGDKRPNKHPILIEAIPLTVNRVIEGTIYWLEDIKAKQDELKKQNNERIIICSKHQTPELLLYSADAYLVKHGGFTSHLAVLGREAGIPVYRYDHLDRNVIQSGEKVYIIPKQEYKYNPPKEAEISLRIITNKHDTNLDEIILNVRRFDLEFGKLTRYFEEIDITLERSEVVDLDEERIVIITYYRIHNLDKLLENIIANPQTYISKFRITKNNALKFLCTSVSENLVAYMLSKYGVEETLEKLKGIDPYWARLSEKYIFQRFGIKIDIDKIRIGLNYTDKEENQVCEGDQTLCYLADIVRTCIKNYEEKNKKF